MCTFANEFTSSLILHNLLCIFMYFFLLSCILFVVLENSSLELFLTSVSLLCLLQQQEQELHFSCICSCRHHHYSKQHKAKNGEKLNDRKKKILCSHVHSFIFLQLFLCSLLMFCCCSSSALQ